MSVSTKFYFDSRIDLKELIRVIESEFKASVSTDFGGKSYGYIYWIPFKNDVDRIWFYPINHGVVTKDGLPAPDTISGSCCNEMKEIILAIGRYFGGWFIENDSDNKQQYIAKSSFLDPGEWSPLHILCNEVLENNPDKVKEYHLGKTALIGLFIGIAMRECKGDADPHQMLDTFIILLNSK